MKALPKNWRESRGIKRNNVVDMAPRRRSFGSPEEAKPAKPVKRRSEMVDVLTTKEVAEYFGASREWVSTACQNGLFPGAFKVGYGWRIPVPAIEEYKRKHGPEKA